MSLVAHALAICATGALVEQVPAWVRVELEPHEPLDLMAETRSVLVAVFVGDETTHVAGRNWTRAEPVVELVVQVLLPPIVEATVDGVVYEFDTAKGGTRGVYAMVHECLRRAFTAPAPGSWGELLGRVWLKHPEPLQAMPGKAEKPGKLPVPIMDYSIPCATIFPPALGEPMRGPWADILAKMKVDAAFTADDSGYFEALLTGAPLSAEASVLALGGLSRAEGRVLGFGVADPVGGVGS